MAAGSVAASNRICQERREREGLREGPEDIPFEAHVEKRRSRRGPDVRLEPALLPHGCHQGLEDAPVGTSVASSGKDAPPERDHALVGRAERHAEARQPRRPRHRLTRCARDGVGVLHASVDAVEDLAQQARSGVTDASPMLAPSIDR